MRIESLTNATRYAAAEVGVARIASRRTKVGRSDVIIHPAVA
jgi:hypothetical protein